MKGGVSKRLEETVAALDKGQLKKALYLTEGHEKLSRHHEFIKEAARICLANKDDKKVCQAAINEARNKIQETISLPVDDTSLEGLEEYLIDAKPSESKIAPDRKGFWAKAEKSDEELWASCEDCHIALAAAKFADICAEKPEEAGGCELIGRSLENENTEPVDWLKAMVETAEKAQGKAKAEMVGAISELTDYLERRNSPFLKALDKEVGNAETAAIPTHPEEQKAGEPANR